MASIRHIQVRADATARARRGPSSRGRDRLRRHRNRWVARVPCGSARCSCRRAQHLRSVLREIHFLISGLVEQFAPDAVAVESVFTALNMGTALKLAEMRGVVLLAAAQAHISAHSYAPREVKASVAGFGGAPKSRFSKWSIASRPPVFPRTRRCLGRSGRGSMPRARVPFAGPYRRNCRAPSRFHSYRQHASRGSHPNLPGEMNFRFARFDGNRHFELESLSFEVSV